MKKINFINGQEPALNDTNLNQLQNNIEEAITEVERKSNYSLEEQVVGTFLGKTLYRKVLTGTLPTGAGDNIFNFENLTIRNYSGFVNSKWNSWFPLGGEFLGEPGYEIKAYLNQERNKLTIDCGDYYTISSSYEITIEYTKATD